MVVVCRAGHFIVLGVVRNDGGGRDQKGAITRDIGGRAGGGCRGEYRGCGPVRWYRLFVVQGTGASTVWFTTTPGGGIKNARLHDMSTGMQVLAAGGGAGDVEKAGYVSCSVFGMLVCARRRSRRL